MNAARWFQRREDYQPPAQAVIRAPAPDRTVNNSEWTAAGDAVACLLPMSARNNRILHIDGDSFFASCEIAPVIYFKRHQPAVKLKHCGLIPS